MQHNMRVNMQVHMRQSKVMDMQGQVQASWRYSRKERTMEHKKRHMVMDMQVVEVVIVGEEEEEQNSTRAYMPVHMMKHRVLDMLELGVVSQHNNLGSS